MKLVLISDLHMNQPELPDGDVLICAGDLSHSGSKNQVIRMMNYLEEQTHRYKIFIAGNHDFGFEKKPERFKALVPDSITYLKNSEIEIDGLKFW